MPSCSPAFRLKESPARATWREAARLHIALDRLVDICDQVTEGKRACGGNRLATGRPRDAPQRHGLMLLARSL
jgi:hypothetical protein